MSKIVLPPLPGYGDLANALGASLAMQMCVTKWKDGIDIEVLQRDVAAMLRARDLEVARVVLESAAKVCEATYQEHKNGRFVTLPQFDGGTDCADAIRALKVSHE